MNPDGSPNTPRAPKRPCYKCGRLVAPPWPLSSIGLADHTVCEGCWRVLGAEVAAINWQQPAPEQAKATA